MGRLQRDNLRSGQSDALLDDPGVGRLNVVGQRPALDRSDQRDRFPSAGSDRSNVVRGRRGFRECKRSVPSGAPYGTPTLIINAGRVTANGLTITNPTIRLGSPSAVATLVFKDLTLSAANSVRVQSTAFDTSEAEIHARIRVDGSVVDNGTFDVGTTGIDVN